MSVLEALAEPDDLLVLELLAGLDLLVALVPPLLDFFGGELSCSMSSSSDI